MSTPENVSDFYFTVRSGFLIRGFLGGLRIPLAQKIDFITASASENFPSSDRENRARSILQDKNYGHSFG